MLERETRFVHHGEVRAKEGATPGLKGTASVYNRQYDTGWFVETIKPGAFARVLRSNPDVVGLFNHNVDNLLSRTTAQTLRLQDSPEGLLYEMDTDPETSIGRDVQRMVERGDLRGNSFSFTVSKQTWREEKAAGGGPAVLYRDIEEIEQLFDVGPVTFPAYTDTRVDARSLWPQGIPEEVRGHVSELRAEDEPTKKVAGEELTRDAFLLAGDPDKTDTWALPWKFSTAAKTRSHLRDALARFDQVKGYSSEAMEKAWSKLLMLADHYGIDVQDKTMPRSDDAERETLLLRARAVGTL